MGEGEDPADQQEGEQGVNLEIPKFAEGRFDFKDIIAIEQFIRKISEEIDVPIERPWWNYPDDEDEA